MGTGDTRKRSKVFRDPVHNLISLAGEEGLLIRALIDRPEFQRLRRIRQLGLSLLTYPGAEHSRWTHSLGVYHVARRMLDALRDRYSDASEYEQLAPIRNEILVAALLHDIGHGPFSHLFENVLPKLRDAQAGYPIGHEDWSRRIISDAFGDMLHERGVNIDVVTGLIDARSRRHLLAKDILSSQLDADRMDYLLRDSWAAGPRYGHFDLEWMLHALRIGQLAVPGRAEPDWRLCFDSVKARHVVEEFIQAREFMYVQVYIHKTTRAYEALFRNIFALAANICRGDPDRCPDPCPPALRKMLAGVSVGTAEYLSLDDFRIWTTLVDWSHQQNGADVLHQLLAAKCDRLVNRRRPYRFIALDSREKQDAALRLVMEVMGSNAEFSCHRDEFKDVAYRNVFYRKSREDEEEAQKAIYFIEPDGMVRPIESVSSVIRAISEIETEIYRLYYDPDDQAIVSKLKQLGWIA